MAISLRDRFNILKRDGFRCQYCGVRAGDAELCVDHVIPKAGDGPDSEWNLLTACHACNSGKADIYDPQPLTRACLLAWMRRDTYTAERFCDWLCTDWGYTTESLAQQIMQEMP